VDIFVYCVMKVQGIGGCVSWNWNGWTWLLRINVGIL